MWNYELCTMVGWISQHLPAGRLFFWGGGGGVGINSLKVLWVTAGASGKSLRLSPGAAFALLKKVTRDG